MRNVQLKTCKRGQNYFLLVIRNIRKNKLHTFINIVGMMVAFACSYCSNNSNSTYCQLSICQSIHSKLGEKFENGISVSFFYLYLVIHTVKTKIV